MLIFAVRLILEDNGKLLFLRQTKRNGGRYTLIGGNVEETEFAREALAREASEEAQCEREAGREMRKRRVLSQEPRNIQHRSVLPAPGTTLPSLPIPRPA